jgi:diguanylate cyclase
MKYEDSRPRSAEVLRLALARMGEHDAAFNPLTYAVWYEHLSGINARLSRAMDPLLAAGQRLDDAAIEKLFRSHVAHVDEETAARVTRDFMRVMNELSETAARTGGSASELGDKLGVLNQALQSKDAAAIGGPVDEALASAGRMRNAVDTLQQQVSASQQEIDRLRAELHRTREEAALCPLTRVLNRKGFDDQLKVMLAKAADSPKPGCLVMVDVDHFKQVNDTYGHVLGDRVLAGLGELLRQVAAESGATAARYGGEEFALLLPSCGLGAAVKLAEVLRERTKAMRIRHRSADKPLSVTVSAGVAELCATDDAASVVARADGALYQSKRQGRDRVTAA